MDVMRNAVILLTSLFYAVISTDVLADEYVAVKARLASMDHDFAYTIEKNGRHTELRAPSATFEIISPKSLSGRIVRILFYEGDLTDILNESGNIAAEYYSLDLPKANVELGHDIVVSDYQVNRIEPTSVE